MQAGVVLSLLLPQARHWPQHRLECKGVASMDEGSRANSLRMRLLVQAMVSDIPRGKNIQLLFGIVAAKRDLLFFNLFDILKV